MSGRKLNDQNRMSGTLDAIAQSMLCLVGGDTDVGLVVCSLKHHKSDASTVGLDRRIIHLIFCNYPKDNRESSLAARFVEVIQSNH